MQGKESTTITAKFMQIV